MHGIPMGWGGTCPGFWS